MNIVSVINTIILAIGIGVILNLLQFKKIDKKKLIYMSFAIFIILNEQSSGIIYFNQILVVILIGIFEMLDNGDFFKGALSGGGALLICGISSTSIMPFMNIEAISNNRGQEIIFTISSLILAIGLSILIRRVYKSIKLYIIDNLSWKIISMVLVLIVGILSIYISLRPSDIFTNSRGEMIIQYERNSFLIYLIILIGLIYILGLKLIKEVTYKQKIQEAENLKNYTSSLEIMSEELRIFKHDYTNIITSIVGYIDDEDINGLKKYMYSDILSMEKKINKNNMKLHLLKYIKNSEIKGLISIKILKAQELSINVAIDIMEEIDKLNLDVIVLCRILGILFDNAIEECITIKESKINFGIIKNKESIDFIIENTCRDNIEEIYILNSKGFSTKGKNRGLGLFILEDLVDKNENILLDTIIENKTFTQILTVMR